MHKPRILVVEDDSDFASCVALQLGDLGYEPVGVASRSEDAIALAGTLRPDLVLMDIRLWGPMDGIAAAHAIRARYYLPVVFMTGLADDDTISRAKLSEPFGFILKPFSDRELRAVLELAIYKHEAEARLRESERRFRAIFEAGPECVKLVTPDGELLEMNAAGLAMLEADSVAEVRTRGVLNFVLPEYRAAFGALHQQVIEGVPGMFEFEATGLRGTRLWLETHAVPMRDASGRVVMSLDFTRDITERKLSDTALRESARLLQATSQRVLEAQETERRRVAHELHDELGQALTAIKINLQASERFRGQSPKDLNAENIRIIEEALQHVRRLALALRPSMLDDLGLVPALRWVAEQTAQRSGFAVDFHCAMPQTRLPPSVETACFRIVQEALTNIARHSRATSVDIDLYHEGDGLVLSVHDDGQGFDVAAMQARAASGGSIGVLGMQERATLIGGQLEIRSRPGHGSTFRLRCPLRRRGEAQ